MQKKTVSACQIQAIGVDSRHEIPSSSFTASSSRAGNVPDKGRLYGDGAWLPSSNSNPKDYLQIHLKYVFFICAVATQGNPQTDQWTSKYKLLLSLNSTTWMTYKENGADKVSNECIQHSLIICFKFVI